MIKCRCEQVMGNLAVMSSSGIGDDTLGMGAPDGMALRHIHVQVDDFHKFTYSLINMYVWVIEHGCKYSYAYKPYRSMIKFRCEWARGIWGIEESGCDVQLRYRG